MRIGIINDRPSESGLLQRAIALRPEHRVLWSVESTADAMGRCVADAPDLVLVDVVPSSIDGILTVQEIKAHTSCAILIVTKSVEAAAAKVFEAMGDGALDAVDAPTDTGVFQDTAAPLLAKIATISRLLGESPLPATSALALGASGQSRTRTLVAIGASAGGPAALASIVCHLPLYFPAAIVIVQHVEEQFIQGMAEWLSRQTPLPVQVAREGDYPAEGVVLLAGTSDHLVFKGPDRLGYTAEPLHQSYRPSIDVFFQSVGAMWKGRAVGVLLTGMGRDGAAGLKVLRERGFHTIAQDEASCLVYGMPKAAARMNAAVDILPAAKIAQKLVQFAVGEAAPVSSAKR